MKLDFIYNLMEDRVGGQAHPEDSIFDGAAAAQQMLAAQIGRAHV